VPSTNDVAWITTEGTYTVTLNAAATLAGLNLGGTSGTQTLNQVSTLTLNGPAPVRPTVTIPWRAARWSALARSLWRAVWLERWTIGSAGSSLVVTAMVG